MIYNFRIDREQRDEIMRRLRSERLLSQGWGGGEKGNLEIERDDFVSRCKDFYGLATTRIPTNLTRMRVFKNNDIIVTPHFPENGKVSIHTIDGDFSGCYNYLNNDVCHLNHRLRVKKSYGLGGGISIYNEALTTWYGKLPWCRLPILPIAALEPVFKGIIAALDNNPDTQFPKSSLDDFLGARKTELLDHLRDKLRKISPSLGAISFETVCKHLLTFSGYNIERCNVHDGVGGDIDLWCVRDRSDKSPFEIGQTVLFVQAKKHSGITDEQGVLQLLKMMENDTAADGCVMSLGDDFNDKAKQLANENGILLMDGRAVCALLLQALAAKQYEMID